MMSEDKKEYDNTPVVSQQPPGSLLKELGYHKNPDGDLFHYYTEAFREGNAEVDEVEEYEYAEQIRRNMMAMTPEKKVKERVAKQLRKIDAYFFYPATGGYGRSGVPDIVGCYKGMFFSIECKAGKNTPTPLQRHELHRIRLAEGLALVVNEENMDSVADVLELPWKET
jgi:hypothetical protein